jgi:hypothetical protein
VGLSSNGGRNEFVQPLRAPLALFGEENNQLGNKFDHQRIGKVRGGKLITGVLKGGDQCFGELGIECLLFEKAENWRKGRAPIQATKEPRNAGLSTQTRTSHGGAPSPGADMGHPA